MTGVFPRMTFGYEFEVSRNGAAVLHQLNEADAVPSGRLHAYHCDCSDCEHDNYGPNDSWLFSAQEDCTVSAEFPSKILEWGSERAERAFRVMEHAATVAGADLSGNSGMHVHVCKPPRERVEWVVDEALEDTSPNVRQSYLTTRQKTSWRLARLFMRYQNDLHDIAAGARDDVRGYNRPNTIYGSNVRQFWDTDVDALMPPGENRARWGTDLCSGSYLDMTRHTHTYEFRLWNATKAAWRQRLAVAMSVAMVVASQNGVDVTEHDPRTIEEVLSPWLDSETWASLIRQRYSKGGVEQEQAA